MNHLAELGQMYYPAKYGIDFGRLAYGADKLTSEANGYPFIYTYTNNSLIMTSLPDADFDDEPRYEMAGIISRRVLTPTLITKFEGTPYPIFYAHGFVNILLRLFASDFDSISVNLYNEVGIHDWFDQFFNHYEKHSNPTIAFAETRIGTWLAECSYDRISPDSQNVYSRDKSEVLRFSVGQ